MNTLVNFESALLVLDGQFSVGGNNDARQAHKDETTLTLDADKGYDAKEFIEALQEMNVLPHVA